MNNVLGDALQKALDAKKHDYSNFIWKGEKIKTGDKYEQKSIRLVDMTDDELKKCYNHCKKMLNNDNPKHLGRYNVLEEVNEQINKCNIELFLRYCENTYLKNERNALPRRDLYYSLRQFMENVNKSMIEAGRDEIEDWSTVPMSQASSNLPEEFENINISDVIDGCIDCLGAFDKKHLTLTFITKMGLWFTKGEEGELKASSNFERLKLAKEKLHLPDKLILKFSEKGLSYHEMRAVLNIQKKQKYSDMTNEQLVTLRNKILLRFQREVDNHIYSWKRLQKQIELVARSRELNLNE